MLKIKNLSVSINSNGILKNISFQTRAGQILGIIGPNGAGKTTLLRAINGLLPIQQGQVILNNYSLLDYSSAERSKLIATIPQAAQLPPAFSVMDVVLMGRTPYLNWLGQTSSKDDEIARRAMRQTKTVRFASRMINELSAGEQQRVLLARALAQTTAVLLMDEPTTHLDLRYQIKLLDLVRNLVCKQRLIALIVLHDLNLAGRYANHLLLLDHGSVASFGSTREVLQGKILSNVYQLPVIVSKKNKMPLIYPG